MSSELDTTRIVRSWLRTDEHERADRVLENVLDLLDATPQRRAWWPVWRFADMNSFAKVAIATAAVVVIAVVGFNLLPREPSTGGQVVDATPSISPSPSPSTSASPQLSLGPQPSPVAGAIPSPGALEVRRHAFSQNGVDFTLEISMPGWVSSGIAVAPDGGHIAKGPDLTKGAAWMLFWNIDGVYADPCGKVPAPPVGPSAADLASAVATLPGAELVSAPSDVTVGGRPAKHVAIRIPEDIACAPSQFNLWYDAVRCDDVDSECYRWASAHGETNQVWIIEVDGKHVWIEAETYKDATPEIQAEVQAIIDSIQFE